MNNRKKLNRLFAQAQTCHWCGILTRRIVPANGEQPPDDMATFDHLIEGSNVMRPVPVPRPGVLSCFKCNHARGHAYMKVRSAHLRNLRAAGVALKPCEHDGARSATDGAQRTATAEEAP
jgi:hypothetical protein